MGSRTSDFEVQYCITALCSFNKKWKCKVECINNLDCYRTLNFESVRFHLILDFLVFLIHFKFFLGCSVNVLRDKVTLLVLRQLLLLVVLLFKKSVVMNFYRLLHLHVRWWWIFALVLLKYSVAILRLIIIYFLLCAVGRNWSFVHAGVNYAYVSCQGMENYLAVVHCWHP